jgi:hypothetical protein
MANDRQPCACRAPTRMPATTTINNDGIARMAYNTGFSGLGRWLSPIITRSSVTSLTVSPLVAGSMSSVARRAGRVLPRSSSSGLVQSDVAIMAAARAVARELAPPPPPAHARAAPWSALQRRAGTHAADDASAAVRAAPPTSMSLTHVAALARAWALGDSGLGQKPGAEVLNQLDEAGPGSEAALGTLLDAAQVLLSSRRSRRETEFSARTVWSALPSILRGVRGSTGGRVGDEGASAEHAALLDTTRNTIGLLSRMGAFREVPPWVDAARVTLDGADLLTMHAKRRQVVTSRWISLLGMAGRYDDAVVFVRERFQHGQAPGGPEVRALMAAAVDSGRFNEATRLFLSAPDFGVSAEHMRELRALMVDAAFEAAQAGRALDVVAPLRSVTTREGGEEDQGGEREGEEGEEVRGDAARGSGLLSQSMLQSLTRSLVTMPGTDAATEPTEPVCAATAATVATGLCDDYSTSLRMACILSQADGRGVIFIELWREQAGLTALLALLRRTEPERLAAALSGGPLALRRLFDARLKALASALAGQDTAGLAQNIGESGAAHSTSNRKRRIGRDRHALQDAAAMDGAREVEADAAASVYGRMSKAVCSAAILIMQDAIQPALKVYALDGAAPGSAADARDLLVERLMGLLSSFGELGVQPDGRCIATAVHTALCARAPEAIAAILSGWAGALDPPAAAALVEGLTPFVLSPAHAATVLRSLPALMAADIRPTDAQVSCLIASAGRAWAAGQSVSCPTCAPEHSAVSTHVSASGVVTTHYAVAPLTRTDMSSLIGGRESEAAAEDSSAEEDKFSDEWAGNAAHSPVASVEQPAGEEFRGPDLAHMDEPVTHGRRRRGDPRPPVSSSSTGALLLRALRGVSDGVHISASTASVTEPPSSVRCLGARSHNARLNDEWPTYPSQVLSVLGTLGLLTGPSGAPPSAAMTDSLVLLAAATQRVRCGREAWAVWTTLRALRARSVYERSDLVRGLLSVFLSGGLLLPAWEAYLTLFPRPRTGPLPTSLAAMSARLEAEIPGERAQPQRWDESDQARSLEGVPQLDGAGDGSIGISGQAALAAGLNVAAKMSAVHKEALRGPDEEELLALSQQSLSHATPAGGMHASQWEAADDDTAEVIMARVPAWKRVVVAAKSSRIPAASSRILDVRGLPAAVTALQVVAFFRPYGNLVRVHLPSESPGSALVQMQYTKDAKDAVAALHGLPAFGGLLSVERIDLREIFVPASVSEDSFADRKVLVGAMDRRSEHVRPPRDALIFKGMPPDADEQSVAREIVACGGVRPLHVWFYKLRNGKPRAGRLVYSSIADAVETLLLANGKGLGIIGAFSLGFDEPDTRVLIDTPAGREVVTETAKLTVAMRGAPGPEKPSLNLSPPAPLFNTPPRHPPKNTKPRAPWPARRAR